ncbi:MAG TPA: hypothetical protein VK957_02910 [Lunatimonas sp.]|nr:hypothetical protein [Lunatimonas sp.]
MQQNLSRASGFFQRILQDAVLRDHVIGEQQDQNGRLFQAAESGNVRPPILSQTKLP